MQIRLANVITCAQLKLCLVHCFISAYDVILSIPVEDAWSCIVISYRRTDDLKCLRTRVVLLCLSLTTCRNFKIVYFLCWSNDSNTYLRLLPMHAICDWATSNSLLRPNVLWIQHICISSMQLCYARLSVVVVRKEVVWLRVSGSGRS